MKQKKNHPKHISTYCFEIIRSIKRHEKKKQTQLGSMLMLVMLQGELPLGGSKARGPEIRIHRREEQRMIE